MLRLNSTEVRQLLHNKFVVILGDSIQRSVYKDLIQLLQNNSLLTSSQMKSKGELSFENDHLIEGGVLDGLHNGTRYREVRQYRTRYHLVRFYFLTRIYSDYFESILRDFVAGPQPDVLIINSCVWDLSRYGSSSMMEYRKNLVTAFNKLDAAVPPPCLIIWNMTMPLGSRIRGGFLIPELQHLSQTLRQDIIEGNFYGATLAALHLFDVVDLHFHFRFDMGNRIKDGIHWNNVVHRRITNLLLTHLADAWGVVIPEKDPWGEERKTIGLLATPEEIIGPGQSFGRDYEDANGFPECPTPTPGWLYHERQAAFADRYEDDRCYPEHPSFYDDSLLVPNNGRPPTPFSGFTSFEEFRGLAFRPDNMFRDVPLDNFPCHPWVPPDPFLPYPSYDEDIFFPKSRWHRQGRYAGAPLVMRQEPSYRRDALPYRKRKVSFNHH
ncbi:PC-esterase domain-containing protein 1A isoform X2 [Erythrolamprus reginae]